ncbi:MAG TPA: DNA polymerase I [Anaerolineales bacterium]|nr:DNA polymerase I [Anaerolineales bacterium]
MSQPARLFLIDGHALAYRTYYALTRADSTTRWTTKSGEPTAGVYGFASVLMRLIEQESPEYLAVSFDTGRTFRDDLFPEYKATRSKMPEDLAPQLDRIRQLVGAFGIPVVEAEGYEADDVLGSIARRASGPEVRVIILTGDRDLLQLADSHVIIRLAGQKLSEAVDFGPAEVQAKLGIRPEQLVDYKALVGDTSDNIPGVSGIGEKTAIGLLTEYGDLDNIYEHLEAVPARFRSKLEQGRESAYLSRRLARIVTDLEVPFNLEASRWSGYDREAVAEIYRQLEFRSLLDRLPRPENDRSVRQLPMFATSTPPEKPADPASIIDTTEKLATLARRLQEVHRLSLDVETTSTEEMQADLVGVSLALSPEEGYYLPVGHLEAHAGGPQLPMQEVLSALRPAFESPAIEKIGHNLKYDFTVLARYGLRPAPLTFDTMLAEWICDPASRNLGLKNLAWVRLGLEMVEIQELIGRGKGQQTMAEVPIATVAPYAIDDAQACCRLLPELEQELRAKQQESLFRDVEMPLLPVLAEMEIAGVLLDRDLLRRLSGELQNRLVDLESEIFKHVGHSFNVNSTQQLSKVLFDEMGLRPRDLGRKTASGHLSTSADVLEEMRSVHPVVALILDQREMAKLKSTYTDALPGAIDPYTGRVHTSFSQTGSVTGRLASSNPNLQNIPIRTELGRRIRQAFIAAAGQILLSVDYSQIELRIVAHMAEDQAMMEAFHQDQDIHAATAAAVFGLAPDQVNPEMRRRAKAVNFGLIYGMSPFGLSRSTDLTLGEAEQFVKTYFERFPRVREFLDATRRVAARQGYVETLLGRRRYFPQLADNMSIPEPARARARREAINAPIQGTAADIIKLAMLRIPLALQKAGLSGKMILQVHDELVLECPPAELAATARVTQEIMQAAYPLRVPLKTDAKAGLNWCEMQPVH